MWRKILYYFTYRSRILCYFTYWARMSLFFYVFSFLLERKPNEKKKQSILFEVSLISWHSLSHFEYERAEIKDVDFSIYTQYFVLKLINITHKIINWVGWPYLSPVVSVNWSSSIKKPSLFQGIHLVHVG